MPTNQCISYTTSEIQEPAVKRFPQESLAEALRQLPRNEAVMNTNKRVNIWHWPRGLARPQNVGIKCSNKCEINNLRLIADMEHMYYILMHQCKII